MNNSVAALIQRTASRRNFFELAANFSPVLAAPFCDKRIDSGLGTLYRFSESLTCHRFVGNAGAMRIGAEPDDLTELIFKHLEGDDEAADCAIHCLAIHAVGEFESY